MTNEEIRARIPHLKNLTKQYESDLNMGAITEEKYYRLNGELIDEISILEEIVDENNRRERFDEMMGHPLKALGDLFK